MQIIPLAGKGSRFRDQGYDTPKYLLPLKDKPILEHILSYFHKDRKTLLIANASDCSASRIQEIVVRLGFECFDIVEIGDTEGQLETVVLGIKASRFQGHTGPMWIYNGDTVRQATVPYDIFENHPHEGFVEVFEELGDHWSFADNLGEVRRVVEKERISNFCSTGLYGFRSTRKIISDFEKNRYAKTKREFYVSTVFQSLLEDGRRVFSFLTPRDKFVLCGTPEEYRNAINSEL
ncbi:MAG: hypothetical protein ACPG6J_01415 [Flavobacteriaceae bacterium]